MENGENFDEIFDLKPIFPEIYSHGSSSFKPQISDNTRTSPSPSPPTKLTQNSLINNKPPMSWNSAASSSNSTAPPKLISFETSNSPQLPLNHINSSNLGTTNDDYSLTSDFINFSASAKDQDCSSNVDEYSEKGMTMMMMNHKRLFSAAAAAAAATRTPSQAQDHVFAERKRRENLSQLFISLSKVVPGLKKLDKASLLEDGINYVKNLQERVRILEEEEERRSSSINNIDVAATKEIISSSSSEYSKAPEIEARIKEKHVLIKIFCKKRMGLMSRIPSKMMEMHLNVVDMRIMPFGGTALDITILAEMQSEMEVTVKGIVDDLHTLFLN